MRRQVTFGRRWLPWPAPRDDRKVVVQPEAEQQSVQRQAFAEWGGGFTEGKDKGTVTTDGGGLLKVPCSLGSQLAGTPGTDPEELLAAVHAASFCMALVAELNATELKPRSVHATATVTLEKQAQEFKPTKLHLDVTAWVPGVDPLNFDRAVDNTKDFWKRSLPFNGQVSVSVSLNAW